MTLSPFDDPAALVLEFDDPAPRDKGMVTAGRYRLPNRDGSPKLRGWMRSTNLASAISDQKMLQNWTVRTALAGLATDPGLYAELCALIDQVGTDKESIKAAQDEILDLAERAKDLAGGGYGRERGNRIHEIVEADWSGLPPGVLAEGEADLLARVRAALDADRLEPIPGMQERIVLCEEVEAVGKLDSLARDLMTGLVHVIDTKSQQRFWTWLEVEAQLAEYANAVAMWNMDKACWEDMPYVVDRECGAAVHCPEDGVIAIRPLDLERGWETARLAYRVVQQRSACKSTRQAVSGTAWDVARTERWARRLRDVSTPGEGSRVWAEIVAAGMVCPELEQVADSVRERLTGLLRTE